ncbi:DNA polymerase III subunit delta' [Sediminitomix flava]|uniref:DNA polymerase-3 subunit delta n=1 Tax=Sediminitomix flava TaxID=379075 RepID=A0A315Z7X7_SEDFL|nr:DNA polymerase III subunit delta' [Sediminitomix flava]PWJ41062.1 DNA polymerase-3 subunit delta' [Sediminitomix flava]
MKFSEISGLEEIKQTLVQAVQKEHIAHAQLFLGKEGSGHLAMALAFATYVNCTNKQGNDSCGECASCRKFAKLVHPDLHFIVPTATTSKVTKRTDATTERFLPEWREFLLENPYADVKQWGDAFGAENKQCIIPKEESKTVIRSLSLKAFEAEYKVMLIWLPELMHDAAANALLKILEEPPTKTLFLLVSNKGDAILPTILSRTQIIQVRKFSDQEITDYLVKREIPQEQATHAAYLADGDLNEALKICTEVDNESEEAFQEWMRACFRADFTGMVKQCEVFNKLGREAQKGLFMYGLNMFRESLIWIYSGNDLVRLEGKQMDFVQNFSKVLHEDNLPMLAELLNDAIYHIERNANPKITFLNLSIKIARIFRMP